MAEAASLVLLADHLGAPVISAATHPVPEGLLGVALLDGEMTAAIHRALLLFWHLINLSETWLEDCIGKEQSALTVGWLLAEAHHWSRLLHMRGGFAALAAELGCR